MFYDREMVRQSARALNLSSGDWCEMAVGVRWKVVWGEAGSSRFKRTVALAAIFSWGESDTEASLKRHSCEYLLFLIYTAILIIYYCCISLLLLILSIISCFFQINQHLIPSICLATHDETLAECHHASRTQQVSWLYHNEKCFKPLFVFYYHFQVVYVELIGLKRNSWMPPIPLWSVNL